MKIAAAPKVAGCLLVSATLVVLLWAVGLQFHIENTDDAIYETTVGSGLLAIAWLGLPLGVAAIVVRRRDVAVAVVCVGAALLGFGVVRARLDLDPEAGERRVASAFVAPVGATPVADDYEFPTLRREWIVRDGEPSAVCDEVRSAAPAWSERPPSEHTDDSDGGCWLAGSRDGHDLTVSVGRSYRYQGHVEVSLGVTRRL